MKTALIALVGVYLTSLADQAVAQERPVDVNGLMVEGVITDVFRDTSVAGGIRYWTKYLGGDFLFGLEKQHLEDVVGTPTSTPLSSFLDAGILLGYPVHRVKPHIRVGVLYSYLSQELPLSDIHTVEFNTSIGMDFRASEHILVGIDAFSYSRTLMGLAPTGVAVTGWDIALFNRLRVAFIF